MSDKQKPRDFVTRKSAQKKHSKEFFAQQANDPKER
jgi:hypothetical protein